MESHQLQRKESLSFLLAGKAIATFKNPKTNKRYTYKVKCSKRDRNFYFVSVLYGNDNEHSYTYIGVIAQGQFKLTKNSKLSKDDIRVKVFDYVYRHLKTNTLEDYIEIWHEGKCGKCGRTLTVPESIKSGIGPVCAGMLNKYKMSYGKADSY